MSLAVSPILIGYVLLYTAVPLQQIAKGFEAQGLHIDGLQGSLKTGFSASKIIFQDEKLDVLLENVVFQYQDFRQLMSKELIHIDQITASKIDIHFKRMAYNPLSKEKPTDFQTSDPEKFQKLTFQNIPRVLVDQVDVANCKFTYEGKESFEFQKFLISNIGFENKVLAMEKIWLNSNHFLLSLERATLGNKSFSIQKSQAIVRKNFKPDLLTSDIEFRFEGSANWGTNRLYLELEGFRQSLKAIYRDDQLQISTKDFQPHWYFKNLPPIHTVNLNLSGDLTQILSGANVQGGFFIRNRPFSFVKQQIPGIPWRAQTSIGATVLFSSFRLKPKESKDQGLFKVVLSSFRGDQLSPVLSEIYFNKFLDLNPDEIQTIYIDQQHFAFEKLSLQLKGPSTPLRYIPSRGPASRPPPTAKPQKN